MFQFLRPEEEKSAQPPVDSISCAPFGSCPLTIPTSLPLTDPNRRYSHILSLLPPLLSFHFTVFKIAWHDSQLIIRPDRRLTIT